MTSSFVSGFPPAEALMKIDYQKQLNNVIGATITFCAFVVAIAVILKQKWVEYDMTERVQLVAITVYEWLKTVATPTLKTWVSNTYQAGVKTREIYEIMNSPLFITL